MSQTNDMTPSVLHSHISGRVLHARGPMNVSGQSGLTWSALDSVGIHLRKMGDYVAAMDGQLVGPASGAASAQIPSSYLETWLGGVIRTVSNVTSIDRVLGITTVGQWEDDFIKVRTSDPVGKAEPYSDEGNIPLASFKSGVVDRRIRRFEIGFSQGHLSQRRQERLGIQETAEKRYATALALDNSRNHVGWYGDGDRVYGLLNEPSLPAPIPTNGNLWGGSSKTFAQVQADFNDLVAQIEEQMGRDVAPDTPMTFAIPTGMRRELSLTPSSNAEYSFLAWLRESFPATRVVAASELKSVTNETVTDKAMFYLFLDSVADTEDQGTTTASIIQAVPTRYQVLGSRQDIKGYVEAATAATAGVIVKRPYAIARMANTTSL